MRTNFEIQDFREIKFEDRFIDLHNNFRFQGLQLEVNSEKVTLLWTIGIGDWIPKNEIRDIKIDHFGVKYLKVLPTTEDVTISDREVLSEVTFYPSADLHNDDYFTDKNSAGIEDDIIYSFIGGQTIRIGCEVVILSI